jgi:CheY-like chemotaxis protein
VSDSSTSLRDRSVSVSGGYDLHDAETSAFHTDVDIRLDSGIRSYAMGLTLVESLIPLLLMDDDAFNREGVRLFLSEEGHAIVEAGDAALAWQIATRRTIVAAVIDIALPPAPFVLPRARDSCGVHLARRLKQTYPAIGVVLFSAHEDRGSEVLELLRQGVRGLAYKLKGSPPQALLRGRSLSGENARQFRAKVDVRPDRIAGW